MCPGETVQKGNLPDQEVLDSEQHKLHLANSFCFFLFNSPACCEVDACTNPLHGKGSTLRSQVWRRSV